MSNKVRSYLRKTTESQPPLQALLAAAGLILLIAAITGLFSWQVWSWVLYAVVIGIILGLLVGFIVLIKLPAKFQIATIGGFTGMGIDLAASTATENPATTALTSLADLVSATVQTIMRAVQPAGATTDLDRPLIVGIWVLVATLALVMSFGIFFEEDEQP